MSLEFYNKNINTRSAEEVSTPSPSPSPAVEAPAQKSKGPSIFTSDDAVPVQGSSNEPIQMTSSSATGSKFSGLQLSDAGDENSISSQENSELVKLEEDFALYAKRSGLPEDISFSEYKNVLEQKNPNELTNEEKNFLDHYKAIYNNSDQSTVQIQTNEPIQESMQLDEKTKQRISEYDAILKDLNPKMTAYMKNSKIMDMYLSEHDSKYQKLKTAKAKQQYRDAIIHDFMEAVSPGAKTQSQRRIIQLDIARVFIDCEAKGENPLDLRAQGAIAMKARIDSLNQIAAAKITDIYNQLHIEDLDLDNMKPDEAIFTIGKRLAMYKDPDFEKKYPTQDAQQKVILNQVKNLLRESLSIEFNDQNKDIVYEMGLNIYKEVLQGSNGDIGRTFLELKNSVFNQNELIAKTLQKHPEIIQEATDEDRLILENLKARSEMYISLAAKNNDTKKITENDIYDELKYLKETGNLTKEQAQLYEFYTKIDKQCAGDIKMKQRLFSQEPRFDSFIARRALSKMSDEAYIEAQLVDANGNPLQDKNALSEKYDELIEAMRRDQKYEQFMFLKQSMLKHGFTQEEVNTRIGIAFDKPYVFVNNARGTIKNNSNAGNFLADNNCPIEIIEDFNNALKTSASVLNKEQMMEFQTDLSENAYSIFADNLNLGIHNYWDQATQDTFRNSMVTDSNISSERKSAFTKSYIVTGSPEQQIHDAEYFKTVKDPAVTEGMAAAEPYVDKSVKAKYSAYVNEAMQNNGYSEAQKKDIQQARETGMTKAETAQAKKTQEEVKTAVQKAQQQQKTEQKAQKEALEQKKQTVLNYAKTVIATATASKPKTSTSTAASSHTQAVEDAQKSLNQTLERLAKAQSAAETDRVRRELMMRIEQFQAEVRRSQEERDLRIQLSEREVVNALLAESAAEEAQASQDAQEAVAVATDTEVTAEDGATAEVRSQSEKSGLSAEAVQELRNAYSSGGLVALYDKAATIVGSKAQEKLLNYISHASSSTLHSFADAHSNNKHVLMTLFRNSKDPYIMQLLIRNGYASEVLSSGAVSVKDFMAHASAETVANWLVDLQKTGATYTLKQAFEHLQDDSKAIASVLIPGSDEWRQAQQVRMSTASAEQPDNLPQTDPARTASASVSSNGLFEDYEGLAMGSDRVRMGIPVDKKVDKRFFRMG